MLKRIAFICILIALTLVVTGCEITILHGSGKLITQNRTVSGFTAVNFSGVGDLTITQGTTESLKIEAEDNIMPKIITEVKNGSLYIGFERENWQDLVRPTKTIKYTLAVKNLASLDLSGLGSVTMPALQTDKLTIKVTGAGGIDMSKIVATSIIATMSGAGNVGISGKAGSIDATMAGAGNLGCGDLEAATGKVSVTGLGGATVWVKNSLDIKISGAGSVGYYGSPQVTKSITGLGVVNVLGNK